MQIEDAQREVRFRYCGGFFGQLVSGVLWLVSASLATWSKPQSAIAFLVVGGFFIFPATELLVRLFGGNRPINAQNSLNGLGMQVAFVLPLSMPLLLPVTLHRLDLFFPAMTILLGAHYCPFVFLYGMKIFAILAGLLVTAGVVVAQAGHIGFSVAAWFTAISLLVFSVIGRAVVVREQGIPIPL